MVSPCEKRRHHCIGVARVTGAQDAGGSLLRHSIRVDDELQLGGITAVVERSGWWGQKTGSPRHIRCLDVHGTLTIQRCTGDKCGIAVAQAASTIGAGLPRHYAGGTNRGGRQYERQVRHCRGRSRACARGHFRCFLTYSVKPSSPVPNKVRLPGSGVVVVATAAAAPLAPE